MAGELNRRMLTGNKAAAWGARLAGVDYVPAFPITPQTEIVETLAKWFAGGEMTGKFTNMDSEHSMFAAAGAAAATGVRVFTASSSQGILYGMESLYTVTGWRVPFLMVNVSRALATPITLEPDHNDVLATRDAGLVQLHAETCQEVLDLILIGYRVAEDPRVCLPVLVNMDGFYLSFTREPVLLPEEKAVRDFLPPFNPQQPVFQASTPQARASGIFGGSHYSYFKFQQHLALEKAGEVFKEVAQDYANRFDRQYQALEPFHLEDAEYVFVMSNSFATKGKSAVNMLRKKGIKAGLLKLVQVRPFPKKEMAQALAGKKRVAVIDQNISLGSGGILYPEIAAALYSVKERPETLLSVVGGLGGKDILESDFTAIVDHLEKGDANGPLLLYNEHDLAQFRAMQKIAGKTEEVLS